jgi:hypothetical protein
MPLIPHMALALVAGGVVEALTIDLCRSAAWGSGPLTRASHALGQATTAHKEESDVREFLLNLIRGFEAAVPARQMGRFSARGRQHGSTDSHGFVEIRRNAVLHKRVVAHKKRQRVAGQLEVADFGYRHAAVP